MKLTNVLEGFDGLIQEANDIEKAKRTPANRLPGQPTYEIDSNAVLRWLVKARHYIEMICGPKSSHGVAFAENEKFFGIVDSNLSRLTRLRAIVEAAKDDFAAGRLVSLRKLVQADLFDNELDQANELLATGYYSAAAVIAGVVLETSIRQLCVDQGLPIGKLDRMNADLAKAEVYSKLIQKKVTAISEVRNLAAHGNLDQFSAQDVKEMTLAVTNFVSDQTS